MTEPPEDVRWSRGPLARLARRVLQRLVLIPVVSFLTPVAVRGREHLHGLGPAVYVANHQSHVDTPVCLVALGGRVRKRLAVAAAADYFYSSRLKGALVSLMLGTVPFVRRDGSSRVSLELLKRLLGEGWSVLLFPSGTRGGPDDVDLKPGFAYVAVDAGVPVVPLFLAGPDYVMPKGSHLPLPGGICVHVGEPIEPGTDYDDLVTRTRAAFDALHDGATPDRKD
ncbi:MAG TPA: lysophospholipid acyltransferase family protein [Frankiaceae bacterium]|nr:lysophospholipid acyltransferase family protein [Frankiaceae bacterium]